ncbi:MAG: tetratricopeptide repeat protein, partial [Gammaproteobacteria bacterium]|nr:tetratricopeptide repeat protein [Gammaproteobacteria bacterium]
AVDATASAAVVVPASKQQVPDAPTRATTPAVSIRQADPVTQLRKRVVTALQQRRPSVAERAARDWLVRQPGNADAQLLLQQALVEQGRVDAAIAHLRASLTNTDAPVRVATALAHQLLAAGDDAAALTVLQQYRHNAAANLEFQALLAAVFERTGDYPAAFDRYGYLVTQRPQQGAWWVGLAISSEALGRRGDARAAYQTARSVENLDPALARYASERLAQLGDKQ